MLHKISINEKGILFDGIQLKGVTGYKMINEKGESRLVVIMDVNMYGQDAPACFNFNIMPTAEKISITDEMMEKIKKTVGDFVDKDPKRYIDPELQKRILFNDVLEEMIKRQNRPISFSTLTNR